MKKYTLLIILLLSFTYNMIAQSQTDIGDSVIKPPLNLMEVQTKEDNQSIVWADYNDTKSAVGPVLMIGGILYLVSGLLTVPPRIGSTTAFQPFLNQGNRTLAILGGSTILFMGITVSIASR